MVVCVMTGGRSQEDVSTVHIDDCRSANGKANDDAHEHKSLAASHTPSISLQ